MSETSENKMDLAMENDEQAVVSQEEDVVEVVEEAEAAEAAVEEDLLAEGGKTTDEEAPVDELESAPQEAGEEDDELPMKKSDGVGHLVIVGILSLVLAILLCMPYFLKGAGNSDYDLSEGVAVTVNGVAIGEKDLSNYVENLRNSMGLTDDAAWAEWMAANGYTPETVRDAVIQYYVSLELQNQAVAENNISVSDEAVEEQVNAVIEQFGSQEALEEALAEQGADLDMYRDNIRMGMEQQELAKKVAQDVEPVSDEEVLSILKMYYTDEVPADATSLEGLDEELVSSIREALESSAIDQAYSEWMQNYQSQATIEINDMPEGLSYNVDMSASGQAAPDQAASDQAVSEEVASDQASSDSADKD